MITKGVWAGRAGMGAFKKRGYFLSSEKAEHTQGINPGNILQ